MRKLHLVKVLSIQQQKAQSCLKENNGDLQSEKLNIYIIVLFILQVYIYIYIYKLKKVGKSIPHGRAIRKRSD